MCGIFGYAGRGRRSAVEMALAGLSLLEYRGYDSAGIAFPNPDGEIESIKSVGKVGLLKERAGDLGGGVDVAIAHTRWATHGAPTWENAHPQVDQRRSLALMHNGIIENYDILRRQLQREGVEFTSETDTEVLAHLIARRFSGSIIGALSACCQQLKGSFSLVLIHRQFPDQIFAAARNSPLVLGIGSGEIFISSDLNAFSQHAQKAIFLHSGELAAVGADSAQLWDFAGQPLAKKPECIADQSAHIGKGQFAHFMLKEIFEQPQIARVSMRGRCDERSASAHFEELESGGLDRNRLAGVERVLLVGCGTSWHAGCIAAQWLEELARLPASCEISSEFRCKNPIIAPATLVLAISQSGETADTIAAVRELRAKGVYIVGLCNARVCTLAREVDATLALRAGPEISVCSTKAFTSQLIVLALFALMMGRMRDLPRARGTEILTALFSIPEQIQQILDRSGEIRKLAARYAKESDIFYIGRRYMYPAALEGALKLKEISYINANGYPAGELKHGPIALIGPRCSSIAFAANESTLDKLISNIMEIRARKGRVLAVAFADGRDWSEIADDVFLHEQTLDLLAPVLSSVFGQLFAYFVALDCARDIDCPRNLAKSVTVE